MSIQGFVSTKRLVTFCIHMFWGTLDVFTGLLVVGKAFASNAELWHKAFHRQVRHGNQRHIFLFYHSSWPFLLSSPSCFLSGFTRCSVLFPCLAWLQGCNLMFVCNQLISWRDEGQERRRARIDGHKAAWHGYRYLGNESWWDGVWECTGIFTQYDLIDMWLGLHSWGCDGWR